MRPLSHDACWPVPVVLDLAEDYEKPQRAYQVGCSRGPVFSFEWDACPDLGIDLDEGQTHLACEKERHAEAVHSNANVTWVRFPTGETEVKGGW